MSMVPYAARARPRARREGAGMRKGADMKDWADMKEAPDATPGRRQPSRPVVDRSSGASEAGDCLVFAGQHTVVRVPS